MKKKYFYLFFIYLFSIFAFPLFAMEEGDSDSSFSDLNVSENFKEFYKQYFDKIFAYDQLQEIVKRFSFVFWYLKERNIGNILNFENNTYVDFQEKNLKEEEINQIKIFFKDTVSLISKNNIFNEYLKKSDKEDSRKDFLSDCFKRALKNLSLPEEFFEGGSEVTEDLTFLVKNVSYKPDYIQQHVASDVHSSPEYFGLEYEPMDFSGVKLEGYSLEDLYQEIKNNMKEKDVSFFCGDLADRDSLGFLDTDVEREKGQPNADCKNFFLYNFFKDYYHTVHAVWQLYCLCHEQPDKIKRWQVFGNHETSEMYKRGDYKNCYGYFSGLISRIRKLILPTEIYFLQSNRTIVLRHGFFTQKMNEKNHAAQTVNKNFKFIYLIKEPVAVYDQFSLFIKDYGCMNPVCWSDHHDTNKPLDLDVLVGEKHDGEEINIPMSGSLDTGYRGYYNPYSWKKGVAIGKKTSIENFKLINQDEFLSKDELDRIQNSYWALFCGHSHNLDSLSFSAAIRNKQVSFHPYYVRGEGFLFHFCMCSHHNLYVQWFDAAFKKIKETEPNLSMIDWKSTQPVHALETYQGIQWLKSIMQQYKNYENCEKLLNFNSVIKLFFKIELQRGAGSQPNYLETMWRNVKVIFNSKESQIEHKELSFARKTVQVSHQSLKKVEIALQTEKNDTNEQETQTNQVMSLTLLESKLRSIIEGSFDEIKKPYLKDKCIDTDIDFLRIIGAGFLGAAGLSLVRQVKSQGIKNFSRSIYDSWQQKGKFRLTLKRKDIFIGGGGVAIGYALYSKFPLFFNRKKGNKDNNFQMKEN